MLTTAEFVKHSEYEVAITMTMRLKDWQALQVELTHVWPASELSRHISDVVGKLHATVRASKAE